MSETGNVNNQEKLVSSSEPGNLPETGPLPRGSRLPFTCTPVFTGRKAELSQLAASLLPGGRIALPDPPVKVILSGPPGIGKTTLAVEFCYRFGRLFDGVHWICAGPYNDLETELAQCGARMALPNWPDSVTAQVEAVHWAWQNTRRLIVLDGMEDPARLSAWTRALQGHRLVITADFDLSAESAGDQLIQSVGPLERSDSLAFLRKLAPRLMHASPAENNRLVDLLGDLPLSLSLAGQNLGERAWTRVSDYLAGLQQTTQNLPEYIQSWAAGSPERLVLASVMETTLQQLKGLAEREQTARLAFLAASTCAPASPIPTQLIQRALHLDDSQGPLLEGVLDRLYNLGLLEETDQGPVSHSLLADLAGLFTNHFSESLEPVAAALQEICRFSDQRGLPDPFLPYRSHLQAAAARAETLQHASAGDLWKCYGHHLHTMKEFTPARGAFERALATHQSAYGPNHPAVAADCTNLGRALQEQGDLLGARASFERALAIAGLDPNPDLVAVAALLGDLGQVRHDLDDLSGARDCYQRAQEILERKYGSDNPELIPNLRRHGEVLLDLNDFRAAQACFERALFINLQVHGSGHPDTAADFFHLGRTHSELGETAKARASFENALKVLEKKYGRDSNEILPAATALGRVLLDLNEPTPASDLYERILPIYERITGPDSPEVASILISLGRARRMLSDPKQARRCFERATKIDAKVFGSQSPTVARDLNHLGRVLRMTGHLSEARDCFTKVLEIDEKHNGPEHANVAADLNNLGLIYEEMGDLTKARHYFERALTIDEKIYGPDHPSVGRDINNLGSVLQASGDLRGARICYERALHISMKKYGPNHPDIAVNANNLGRVLFALDDLQAAKACFEQALTIDKQAANGENLEVASDAHNLGRVLIELHDNQGAKVCFETALRIRKKFYPPDHPKVRSVAHSLETIMDWMKDRGEEQRG